MGDYNKMPSNAKEIIYNYNNVIHTLMYTSYGIEHRQPLDSQDKVHTLKIFWHSKERGLGYGIGLTYDEKIKWYVFGTEEEWKGFTETVAKQFEFDS